ALPLDIRGLIVAQGARLIGIGGMIGLAGALTLSRAIRSLLFSVSPSDPATYAAALTVVVVASGFAMWLPTRHATRVDPIASLRSEYIIHMPLDLRHLWRTLRRSPAS